MIGLITSTIYPAGPSSASGEQKSAIPPSVRLQQTEETIDSLVQAGINEIFVFDNSPIPLCEHDRQRLGPAQTLSIYDQFPFRNKGLSEIFLILAGIHALPANLPILKISGRYVFSGTLPKPPFDWEIAGRRYDHTRPPNVSTRMYYMRNSAVLNAAMHACLREMYAYNSRIVGLRSLFRIIKDSLDKGASVQYEDAFLPIECALYRAIKMHKLRFEQIKTLGVRGQFGAISPPQYIEE